MDLEKYGWKFPEIHTDARKMARMAASSYQLFGFESAWFLLIWGLKQKHWGAK